MERSRPIAPLWGYAAIILATITVAGGGAMVSGGESDPWYVALNKPDLTPPGYVFGLVWPTLYILMAAGASLVWRAGGRGALPIYIAQLALNFGWSATFFGSHLIWPAMGVLAALWVAIIVMIGAFRKFSSLAAILQAPYLVWVSFAGYLNGYIALAN